MKTWRSAALLAVMLSLSWTAPARSQTLGLYDDFSSGRLDMTRWLGYEYSIGASESQEAARVGMNDWMGYPSPENEDSVRRVAGGRAQIALTTHREDPERGVMGYFGQKARSGLRIAHLALADHRPAVNTFRATMTVEHVSWPSGAPDATCSGGAEASAGIFGHFFNDGSSTAETDLTGDIFAELRLERRQESNGSVRHIVVGGISRCVNADCSTIRGVGGIAFPGRWTRGIPYVMTIEWQPASNAFVFSIVRDATTESRTVTYTQADQTRPRGYAYDLRVETQPMLCRTEEFFVTVPHVVSIDARFDDVYLDSAAAAATR
jgi:hypothetical protein